MFFIGEKKKRKPSRRSTGRSMLSQTKDVLCVCVSFQEFQDSIKEEPETNVYLLVFITLEETLK